MPNRVKPTEAAKRLDIRPQIIYGLIKRGKISTFDNPAGKVDLVDYDEVKIAVSRMGHRGPRKDKVHKGTRAPGGIRRGSIISHDKFPIKGAFARPDGGNKSVRAVTDPGRGENTLVWLSDGSIETVWGTENLATKIQNKSAHIESVPGLLGMIMFQWREEGMNELADSLEEWAVANEVGYLPINVTPKQLEEDAVEEETKVEPTVWKEVPFPVDLTQEAIG